MWLSVPIGAGDGIVIGAGIGIITEIPILKSINSDISAHIFVWEKIMLGNMRVNNNSKLNHLI